MHDDKFDIENELREGRPKPRGDFASALADQARSHPTERTRLGRVGVAMALSGLIVVALASFGGIGYASSSASHAKKQPTAKHITVVTHSAASAQYKPFKPPKPASAGVLAPPKTPAPAQAAAAPTQAQLPFTGLALWIPLAIGLAMIAVGLTVRTRARRRGSNLS